MKQHLRTIAFGLVLTALIALLAETAWRDVRGKVVSAKREVMRFGFIDKSGAYVIEPEYEFADDFSEGLAPVCIDGQFGYVDTQGAFAIEPAFSNAGPFNEGLAAVQLRGWIGYIDKTGSFIVPPRYERGGIFSDGLAPVALAGKYGYINRSGEFVIRPDFRQAAPFSEGLASVSRNRRVGYIDTMGKEVIPFQYSIAHPFTNGSARVYDGTNWKRIDKTGAVLEITPPPPTELPRGTGLQPKKFANLWGFDDDAGAMIIPATFHRAYPFQDGLARVRIKTHVAEPGPVGALDADPRGVVR